VQQLGPTRSAFIGAEEGTALGLVAELGTTTASRPKPAWPRRWNDGPLRQSDSEGAIGGRIQGRRHFVTLDVVGAQAPRDLQARETLCPISTNGSVAIQVRLKGHGSTPWPPDEKPCLPFRMRTRFVPAGVSE
jgi:hypothetical protein